MALITGLILAAMHMLSVGATGEERASAVFSGLLGGSFGLVAAGFGFFFASTFYPRDYFPRSLFSGDSDEFGSADSGFPDFGGPGFGPGDVGPAPVGVNLLFAAVGLFFLAVGTLWMASFLVRIARTFRAAAWLDGTRVYVRGALRTRSIDLATAYVHQGAITTRTRHRVISTPTLEARDTTTGAKLTIPLEGLGSGRLPPSDLRALAEAMSRGRGNSDNDRDVLGLAENLRSGVV